MQVISKKGGKAHKLFSGSRDHVTFVGCGGASLDSRRIDPWVIFAGNPKKPRKELTKGFPSARMMTTQTGWLNVEAWRRIVRDFAKQTEDLGERVLVADWHATRNDLEALEICKANNIHLLLLPPHTTHLLQPADLAVFRAMKEYFATVVTCLNEEYDSAGNKRLVVQKWDLTTIAEAIGKAWVATFNQRLSSDKTKFENCWTAGFRKAGIMPLNRGAVTPDTFLLSDIWKKADEEVAAAKGMVQLTQPKAPKLTPEQVHTIVDAELPFPELNLSQKLRLAQEHQVKKRRKVAGSGACLLTDDDAYNVMINAGFAEWLADEQATAAQLLRVAAKAEAQAKREAEVEATAAARAAAKAAAADRKAQGLPAKPVFRLPVTFASAVPAFLADYAGRAYVRARCDGAAVDFTLLGKRKRAQPAAEVVAPGTSAE
jgi:hypothetical protein